MCCLESEQVRQLVTTDWKAARVHVLSMMQLTFKVGANVDDNKVHCETEMATMLNYTNVQLAVS